VDPFLLQSIQNDIPYLIDTIQETALQVLSLKVSKYPVFIFHKNDQIPLGIPFISQDSMSIDWNVSLSHLEDLVNKNVVQIDKADDFRAQFKSPTEFVCIFVFTAEDSGFIFYPYPK